MYILQKTAHWIYIDTEFVISVIERAPLCLPVSEPLNVSSGLTMDYSSLPPGKWSHCEHGRQRARCKDCGGEALCHHSKIRELCRDCGGANVFVAVSSWLPSFPEASTGRIFDLNITLYFSKYFVSHRRGILPTRQEKIYVPRMWWSIILHSLETKVSMS